MNNETATDEVIKEETKIPDSEWACQIFNQNLLCIFFQKKKEIIVNMTRRAVRDRTSGATTDTHSSVRLLFYPQDRNYSISHAICHFNTLVNNNSPKNKKKFDLPLAPL
jgi:hypothetical protein